MNPKELDERTDEEKAFAQRVAQLRLAKGVSARDMSVSLGQSPSYIHHIESGKMLPSISAFFYICEYLQITPNQFFSESEDDLQLMQTMCKLKELPQIQKEHICRLIQVLK